MQNFWPQILNTPESAFQKSAIFSNMTLHHPMNGIGEFLPNPVKEIPPANPHITFSMHDSVSDKNVIEIPPNISSSITPKKETGRPKNNKLSALAAKRSGAIKKPSNKTASVNSGKDAVKVSDSKSRSDNVDGASTRQNGLCLMTKLALSQNLAHMATQVRAGPQSVESDDLISMTRNLNCDDINRDSIAQQHSASNARGMGLLFPGRRRCNRYLYVMQSLYPDKFDKSVKVDHELVSSSGIEVNRFDFSTCPINAVKMAYVREMEADKRRKKNLPKRILHPLHSVQKKKKKTSQKKDILPIRRLLKKRTQMLTSKIPKTVIIGPQGTGKSTLLGQLYYILNKDMCDRVLKKLKWDAEKRGRPNDFIAWFIDELEIERKFGHSLDISEISLTLPSGNICHLFDCPGLVDKFSRNADLISIADEIVLLVDGMTLIDEDSADEQYIFDVFQLIKRRRQAMNCSTSFNHLTVILNKMDNCSWSSSFQVKVENKMRAIKDRVFGLESMRLRMLPISARTSEGIMKPKSDPNQGPSGKSLVDILEMLSEGKVVNSEPQENDLKPVIAVVNDVYENMGAGFTAVLHVKEGVISPGQSLTCLPSDVSAQVRTVQVARGGKLLSVPASVTDELAHVVLCHVDISHIARGSILCDKVVTSAFHGENEQLEKKAILHTGSCWKAEIHVHSLNGHSIIPGRQVMFHSFSATSPAYLRRLLWVKRTTPNKALTRTSDEDMDDDSVRVHPYVVSSADVVIGIDIFIESAHVCSPELSINSDFALFDGRSLFATGNLVCPAPSTADVSDYKHGDRTSRRVFKVEAMDIDKSEASDS